MDCPAAVGHCCGGPCEEVVVPEIGQEFHIDLLDLELVRVVQPQKTTYH